MQKMNKEEGIKMKTDGIVDKFKSMKARISYTENGGEHHVLYGWVVAETDTSFIIESENSTTDAIIPKKQVSVISWLRSRPKLRTTRPLVEKKKRRGFSYSLWWKNCRVEEVEHD